MNITRKSFLKGTLAAAALGVGEGLAVPNAESKGKHEGESGMIRGLTVLTMKNNGEHTLGVKTERGILDVAAAAEALGMYAPESTDRLLQHEEGPSLNALVQAALSSNSMKHCFVAEESIVFGPVVSHPEKIVCVGLNYPMHVAESQLAMPKQPVLFNKYNNALSAHNETIHLPVDIATKFDYEVELVIVIGKEVKNISEAEALSYVAGYCVGNDFSARDLQFDTGGQWMVGKSCDQFGVLGPYMLSADLVSPDDLKIELRVNGETRQSDSTKNMIFNCSKIISYTSRMFTLKPGDIIYSGTPAGVILGLPADQQRWLKAGDKIACSIEKLGELRFDLE